MWRTKCPEVAEGPRWINRHVTSDGLIDVFGFSSSSELRAGGPTVGTRPAEDEAGRHAAGRPGPDLAPDKRLSTQAARPAGLEVIVRRT